MQTTASWEYTKYEVPIPSATDNSLPSLWLSSFESILFESSHGETRLESTAPEFFNDLNLDQIVAAITADRDEYNLKPFFYARLTSLEGIGYRQEVMRDLERGELFQSVKSFAARMHIMRVILVASEKSYYKYEKDALFLEVVGVYCTGVEKLLNELSQCAPESRGLLAFRSYLTEYTSSDAFKTLSREAKTLKSELSAIRYAMLIKGNSITVRPYNSEPDYAAEVEKTFAKFKQGAVQDYLIKFSEFSGMNHVEAMILDRVALLNPNVFCILDDFCTKRKGFLSQSISNFDREIQFYIAWLEYTDKLKRTGLKFCYPQVSDTCKDVSNREGFDLALAGKLVRENSSVVCNDFALSGDERIFVVSGPNQGGKTTFARMFGQMHYLASLGCPVPGTEAQLFLYDQIFTHFERVEDVSTLRGKLEDDLVRIYQILQQATANSVIILNEIFSSTTVMDAVYLGCKIIERIAELDALCTCVTFLDELSRLNEKTVSMVAEVVPENPTLRTFKVQKRPANGLAHALAIAEQYRLTSEQLKERLKS